MSAESFELRCHSCSHKLGFAAAAMQLVAQFKASLFGRVATTHRSEVRKRCRSCGWVNVFHPASALTDRRDGNILKSQQDNLPGPSTANHAHRAGWPLLLSGQSEPAPTHGLATP